MSTTTSSESNSSRPSLDPGADAVRVVRDPTAEPVVSFEDLNRRLATYMDPEAITEVNRAYAYAKERHEGQMRRTGHPYITHPTAVAHILADMRMDHQTLMAALLHDVIEDTGVGKRSLSARFGSDVTALVDGVSKLTSIAGTREETQADTFQKMAIAMARDIRVILVKLADRLHNMRTIGAMSVEARKRIARETLQFYAPIAQRLGMHDLMIELEDLGFAALHPMRAERIARAVRSARQNRSELLETIEQAISDRLEREGIAARVEGRQKHLYSIYRKMKTKRKPFAEIMDVFAFRIIVEEPDTCYRTLGAVHGLYKPVAGRFKDYIAIPKANGYQSLHTSLFGMHGIRIEIQIRTESMHQVASKGIAGHWIYKSEDESLSASHDRAREWVMGLLDMQKRAGDSLEFIEHLKTDLFPDEVYVFTPQGRILELPQGASAVDFAYAVHTDIGNTCVACRIDRRLAPLSLPLQSGQSVEIITSDDARPNPDWLSFVVTGKAHSAIRHALKRQKVSESRALGRRLLNRSLSNSNTALKQIPPDRVAAVLDDLSYRKLDDLLEDIGLGNRMAYAVASRLTEDSAPGDLAPSSAGPLAIRGTEGMVVAYGKCCHPLPGDPIVGHFTQGRGLVVHAETCSNLPEPEARGDEVVPVRWSKAVKGEFSAELHLEVITGKGVIAELAATITEYDASIEKINVVERDARLATVSIELTVQDRVHLANIMRALRRLIPVQGLTRHRNSRGGADADASLDPEEQNP